MKVGDLVKISQALPSDTGNLSDGSDKWRGIILKREAPFMSLAHDDDGVDGGEWLVHWLHHPPSEPTFEYGYYLEVLSESR